MLRRHASREVVLERPPHLGSRAVQQHTLIDLAEVESVTNLVGAPPFDVAQRDHRPLARRQRIDRLRDHVARLGGEQALLRQFAAAATTSCLGNRSWSSARNRSASTAASGMRAGSWSAENGITRPSRWARVFAVLTRMRKTHVFSEERPSNRSSAPSTRSHVSCTTSSATARDGTKICATRSSDECHSRHDRGETSPRRPPAAPQRARRRSAPPDERTGRRTRPRL